jgi:hypothetical protein
MFFYLCDASDAFVPMCSISGNKANKARNWFIPVVNHTWLEDCFIQWKNLTFGLEKYVIFPPGLDFSDNLGERGIQRELVLEALPDLVAEMALVRSTATPVAEVSNNDDAGKQSSVHATRPSTRKANEIEDAAGGLDCEDRVNVDVKSQSTDARRRGNDHMQVDEPEAAAPHDLGQHHEPKRTWKSPRRASTGHSPLRQATSPLKHAHKRLSSASKRRGGVDQEITEDEDEPAPTKRSTRAGLAVAGSLVNSPSKAPQKSLSKSSPGSPLLRMESVLMPPMGTGGALAKSSQRSAKTSPVKDKPQGRNPQARSISPERVPLSSLTVDSTMDREEGPSRQVSRRSAASRASQRLREEVMPDVVSFEKEMRRGHVRAAKVPESRQGKDTGSKTVGKGKKRSSVHDEGTLFPDDDEHERKKRRISGTKGRSTGAPRADNGDERSDRVGASSQQTMEISSGKGAKPKKAPPGGDITRQAKQVTRNSSLHVDRSQRAYR